MVADVEDEIGVVLDEEDACAAPAHLPDKLGEALDLVGREPRRRFVEEQEGGAQHEGAGDLDEAQLAVLQPVGADVGERLEADRLQGAARPPCGNPAPRGAGAAARAGPRGSSPLPCTVPPIMTFSITEASPTMRGVWNVRAMPRRARVRGSPGSSSPSPRRTRPSCGR